MLTTHTGVELHAPAESHAPFSDEDFAYLRRVILERAGIHISEGKRAFVAARLAKRLRQLGLMSYAEYCRRLRGGDDGERRALVEAVCTHETRFFREPRHFEFLTQRVIPRWQRALAEGRRSARLRVWSAGCSTGEEAYSLAMTLKAELGSESSLEVELLATDLSTRVLAIAERGIYPLARSVEIPEPYLKQFMQRGRERWLGQMRVAAELRSFVRFEPLNLHRTPFEVSGLFDLIFCRNVLIYFDAPSRARMVRALLESLGPGGLLVVGHAESLLTIPVPARPVVPSVYALRGGLEAP